MKINHYLTFTGPAFVPTSTDETSARETTGATPVDVGVDPYVDDVTEVISNLNAADIPAVNFDG